ncbi:MAG: glycine oxidase ThiO [Methylophilaceae bacterium]|nr:glycine oxidase ThiO [Methylophilaceae bacterium]
MRVVVVGGGIVGCMTAMELVQRGCEVTIVERGHIASQTSGESSWAGAGIMFPLLPWFYSDDVNRLTLSGPGFYRQIFERLHQETGVDVEMLQSGMLILPEFDQEKAQTWCAQHQIQAQRASASAFDVQSLSGDDALWLPTVNQVRPPYVMQALRQWLEQNGVTLLEQTELKSLAPCDDLREWETIKGEKLSADKFVVTSGAWSFELLKDTAQKLKIKPMRGQILLYQPKKNLEQMVYREGFYMVPRQDGLLLAGSTLEDVGFDPSTTEAVRDELIAKAEAIMPALKGLPILKHWSGLRPGTPDNLPTIAEHPQIRNLFLNTGHFRYGLTMAPASAKIVSALVCDEEPFIDANPFACPA